MSDEQKCPRCGNQMVVTGTTSTKSNRPRRAGDDGQSVELVWGCVNPDCPGTESDLAPMAPGQ